ncbi:MAG: Ig-like domain-containing protein [Candidatus Methanoperedens sp.]|nr:Ig-like domain-containing protein [Candidatus Methanoperedens sp.]
MKLFIYLISVALIIGIASAQVSIVNDVNFYLDNSAFIKVLAPQTSTNITIYSPTDSPASTLQFYINGTAIRFTANTNKTLSNISYDNVNDAVNYTGNGTEGYLNVSAQMQLPSTNYSFWVDGSFNQAVLSDTSGWVTFNYTGWSQQHDFEILKVHRGVNLTGIPALTQSNNAGVNVTYVLNLTNSGTASDTYSLSIDNASSATTASLNISSTVILNAGESRIFLLNVTNATLTNVKFQLFLVNITASSNSDSLELAYINTTTNVTATYATSLVNISAITQSTNTGINATYVLNLTNSGTGTDSYTLTANNAGSATTADFNLSSPVTLNSGESRIIALNVTNATLTNTRFQLFLVNITATSGNDSSKFGHINTTTNVTATYATSLLNISVLDQTTTTGINSTYVLNLTNNGTGTDSYTLAIDNADSATMASLNHTSLVTLHAGQSIFFALKVTNATLSSSFGLFRVNVTATSNNDSSQLACINTTTNVTPTRGTSLTSISALTQSTNAGVNVTYVLNLTNSGSASDTYTFTIDNTSSATTASLNISSPVILNAGESRIFSLNVTNATLTNTRFQLFLVNVTAASTSDPDNFAYVNTTTNVTATYGTSLASISALTNSTNASVNATYVLNLTNRGTGTDSYTLAIDNVNSATTASLNITSPVILHPGESKIIALDVTNATLTNTRFQLFLINITATSDNDSSKFGYINTTTNVTATYATSLLNISEITQSTTTGIKAIYVLNLTNNGTGTDSYTLAIDNADSASTASLNHTSTVTLHAGQSIFFALNVTNTASGTFHVNVTATSGNDYTKSAYVNTITTVTAVKAVSMSINTPAQATSAGTNATYLLNLTNTGTDADAYTIVVDNANSASTALLNISLSQALNAGQSLIFALNVTNESSGTFPVNVIATSSDITKSAYVNTTTTVLAVTAVSLSVNTPAQVTSARTNATYLLNLTNSGTDADTYTLVVDNANGASTALLDTALSQTLNAGQSLIFALDVTNTSSGTFPVNITATSVNDSNIFTYINTTTTVTAVKAVSLTVNTSAQATSAGTNATYVLNLTNTGTDADTYTFVVDNANSASTALLNTSLSQALNAGQSLVFALDVTNTSSGTFPVNVIATSSDITKSAYANTTTTVLAVTEFSLTVNTSAQSTSAGTSATYLLNLTNTGSDPDTYNLVVDNANSASTALLNTSSPTPALAPGASLLFSLNVTNTSSGQFLVNVTAISQGDSSKFASVNTSTAVGAVRAVSLSIDTTSKSPSVGVNATYMLTLTNNGSDPDSYTLIVTNANTASIAALDISSPTSTLSPDQSLFFSLNVTNTSPGKFLVNITAISQGDNSKFASVNTSTAVTTFPAYIPPIPANIISNTGNFFMNHTWQAGSGNVTNSYNVSVNGTWHNGTNTYYNNSGLAPHGWSNISVYAFNSSGAGTLNTTAVSYDTQVANNPVAIGNVSGSYTLTAGDPLSIYPTSSDLDGDTPVFARNFTNGTFYTNNGTLLLPTTSSDIGIHSWQITVSDRNGSISAANFTVTVTAPTPVLTSITVSPATASAVVGNTQTFTASPKDQFGNPISATVTWGSSNTGVGTITSAGVFTAISAGTTTITATNGSISGTATVTVTTPTPVLTSIIVSPATASVVVGNTQTFTASPRDQFGNAISATVTWSSSNTGVGTITSMGVFTAISAGTTTITATSGGVSGTATVTVTALPPVLTSITVSPATTSVVVGNTQTFTASPRDQFGNPINATVTWSSSNTGVGTITNAGLFTAIAVGTTTITATNGSISGTATVTVSALPPVLTSITVSPASASVVVGNTQTFTASPRDQFGNPINATVTWSSSNTGVGTITSTGVFTAIAAGTTTITATSGGVSGTATVTVSALPPVLTSITVSPATASVVVGNTQTFTASPKDQFDNPISAIVTWNSSNTGVGTITSAGLFTAIAAGTTTITATNASVSGTATVTVTALPPLLTSITVSPSTASVVVGNMQTFTASPKDQFGNPINATVSWSSSNSTVGTITITGVFTTLAAGVTTITATNGSVSGTATVTVTTILDTTPPLLIVTQPINNQSFITSSITVSGTATDPSGIANITVNGIPVTISPSGSFSTTIILVNGSNTITLTATDASPNANTAIVTRTVTFTPPGVPDTTPPVLIVMQPIDARVFITNSITVNGFATDASGILSVTVNGAPAVITGDSFTSTLTLNPGTNIITVEAIDSSSNHNSANVTRTVNYVPPSLPDTVPPKLVVNQPTNGQIFTTSSIAVSGTATDDSGVKTVSVNGAKIPLSPGHFGTSVFLVPGTNTITVVATDNADNTATITRTITYSPPVVPDTTPPTMVVNTPTNGQIFTTSSTTVSGTAFDSSGIHSVMINGDAVIVDPTGSFSTTVILVNGRNTITIFATDASPNVNTETVTRTVTYAPPLVQDTTPPILAVNQPVNVTVLNTSSIVVSGRAIDDSGIRSATVNGVPVTITSDGRFGTSIDLDPGSNIIIVQAIDSSSNLNTNTTTLMVTRIIAPDTQPPILSVQYPGVDTRLPGDVFEIKAVDNTIEVYGTVSDNTGIGSVTVNGVPATVNGNLFNSSTSLNPGRNTITVIATDNSTNHNTATTTRSVNYSVPVTAPGNTFNITIVSNPAALDADGQDKAKIVAYLTDVNGTAVIDGTNVLFTTSDGLLYLTESDIGKVSDSQTLSAQTLKGIATVVLVSSTSPGTSYVNALANNVSASLGIAFKTKSILDDIFGDKSLFITHSPTFVVDNCSIEINGGVGEISMSTATAIGIVNGTRIGYNIGTSTIELVISNPIVSGDHVIFTIDSIMLNNSQINSNFTGIGKVSSDVDVGINASSKLSGMIFTMSLHPDIADDLMARGGTDAGLVGQDVILAALQSSLGITDVGKHIAFVTSAQLDGATAQDILEVPVFMTVSGEWYNNMAASQLNNVILVEIFSNGSVGQIQTPEKYNYDSVNNSYTFVFRMKGLSTFALIGTKIAPPTPTPTSTTSPLPFLPISGVGGGGAGVISPEPFSNIESFETMDENLAANVPASFIVTSPDLAISEVLITPSDNFGITSVRVELLKDVSKIAGVTPPLGIVYKYYNIWVGAKQLESGEGIIDAFIGFKVDRSWLAENNLDEGSVSLLGWDGSSWVTLETAPKSIDEQFVYYVAKTNAFLPFAIVAGSHYPAATVKAGKIPAIINMPLPKIIESKSFIWVYIIIGFIIIGFVVYILRKNKKSKTVPGKYVTVHEKPMEVMPEDADAWNNRGFDLYEEGKYNEAIKAYDKAIDIMHKSEKEKKD